MKFRMSRNVAIRTQNEHAKAVEFYSQVLGFQNRSADPKVADLDASPLTLYIEEDAEIRGPVMELVVDDLDEARKVLEANGCKVLRWRGKKQDCYVQDPFGVMFNMWEE